MAYLQYDSEVMLLTSTQGAYFILPCVVMNWLSICPQTVSSQRKNGCMSGLCENLSSSFKNSRNK